MAENLKINTLSNYTKIPTSVAEYTRLRGVADFSNAEQFNLYESGYAFLVVISEPKFMTKLGEQDAEVKKLNELFRHTLEYEFKNLDGIEDITTEALEYTDGISTINQIGKVTQQSATEVTMEFYEKSGSGITKYIDHYIRGIRDPRTQAKTYHGLIKKGLLSPGFENEVFNLMYIVTDNTCLNLEKAYLLVNAQPNKVQTSIYGYTKGEIQNQTISVTMNAFVIDGDEVNKRALKMLSYINEEGEVKNSTGLNNKKASATAGSITKHISRKSGETVVSLNSDADDYNYSVFDTVDTYVGSTTGSKK